jgi:hypothetical protein
MQRVFECEPPCRWNGYNKVFFKTLLARPERPDAYLVVVTADTLLLQTVLRSRHVSHEQLWEFMQLRSVPLRAVLGAKSRHGVRASM